jgi:GNAT superfamily N-acetyltransferase
MIMLRRKLQTCVESKSKIAGVRDAMHNAWTGRDGTQFELRPIEAGDYRLLTSFVRRLSFGSRYFRYGRGSFQPSDDEICRMCTPDPTHAAHLLVLHGSNEPRLVVGSGRIVYEPGQNRCELTLIVSDSWQRRGVGRRLLEGLIDSARQKGHQEIFARILTTNAPMLALVQRRGFAVSDSDDGPAVKMARLLL